MTCMSTSMGLSSQVMMILVWPASNSGDIATSLSAVNSDLLNINYEALSSYLHYIETNSSYRDKQCSIRFKLKSLIKLDLLTIILSHRDISHSPWYRLVILATP